MLHTLTCTHTSMIYFFKELVYSRVLLHVLGEVTEVAWYNIKNFSSIILIFNFQKGMISLLPILIIKIIFIYSETMYKYAF